MCGRARRFQASGPRPGAARYTQLCTLSVGHIRTLAVTWGRALPHLSPAPHGPCILPLNLTGPLYPPAAPVQVYCIYVSRRESRCVSIQSACCPAKAPERPSREPTGIVFICWGCLNNNHRLDSVNDRVVLSRFWTG